MKLRGYTIFIGDLILIIVSYLIVQIYKQGTRFPSLEEYASSFILFAIIWVLVSILFKKYSPLKERKKIVKPISRILFATGTVTGIITTLMYFTRIDYYSRFVVFGTIAVVSILEIVFSTVYYWFISASRGEPNVADTTTFVKSTPLLTSSIIRRPKEKKNLLSEESIRKRQAVILQIFSNKVYDFVFKYVPVDSYKTFIIDTISHTNIELLTFQNIDAVVNLKRINDIRYINKFFESVNAQVPNGGVVVDFLETKDQRKHRILGKFPPILNYVFYSFDFVLKRIFPKFILTKKIYFILTRGQNRVLTKAEAFGRLYSCGFEVIDEMEADGYLYFIAIKTKEPLFPEKPTYGPIIQLRRVGKGGKLIKVYKLRTMHPYSEFLQDYVYKQEGLQEGGKFKSDFRVSKLGKFFRVFWLDELPMIVNLLRGDLKIVGVRPISQHYFELYPKEHQKRRIKYKPGLVPPFYVDNPKTLEEIIASEKRYLDAYDEHHIRTDLKYFFKAFYNIIFKKARSA